MIKLDILIGKQIYYNWAINLFHIIYKNSLLPFLSCLCSAYG